MRSIVAGLLLTLALGIASAPPLRACTGCADPFSSVVKPAKAIALVTIDRPREGSIYRVRVDSVYKGALPSRIAYEPDKPSVDLARGSRWILVINPDGFGNTAVHADYAWLVLPNGAITGTGYVAAPASITKLRAWFAPPPTDVARPKNPSMPREVPVPLTLVFLVAGWLCSRRFGRSRRVTLPHAD